MTNPTPHGQVPEALIDLIDAYAEARHRCGCAAYNAQTAEARQRVTDYIESIGAGGMQSLRAPGVVALADVLRKLDDTLGPSNVATTALSRHFSTGTSVEQAPAAINSGVEIIIDFSQVGTAGPFPVVDGRVSLPDATMLDLVHMLRPTYEAQAQQAAPKAAPGEPPGIQALMCVISSLHSLRDTAHFSDEEGELTNDLCTLRDWAYAQTAAFQPSPKAAPDCHHRPPCDECAALAAQETHHEQHTEQS